MPLLCFCREVLHREHNYLENSREGEGEEKILSFITIFAFAVRFGTILEQFSRCEWAKADKAVGVLRRLAWPRLVSPGPLAFTPSRRQAAVSQPGRQTLYFFHYLSPSQTQLHKGRMLLIRNAKL